MWEPCPHCCGEESVSFYAATEEQRQQWFAAKAALSSPMRATEGRDNG